MVEHNAEYISRWLDPIDTMVAQNTMITEGAYAGKKTRQASMFKVISATRGGESEDVQEARSMIASIKRFRKQGLFKDEDGDRILIAAQKIIEEAKANG